MILNEPVVFNAFLCGLKASSPTQILQNIAWKIGRMAPLDMTWLADQLLLAEKAESSGIGNGVAIPHLKVASLPSPFILLARLDNTVDFQAIDNQPVDLICTVISPQIDGPLHLRRLSRVTRLFRDPVILEQLRGAENEDGLASVLTPENRQFLAA